jgi:RNA polymerase-binding protein DksA
MHCSSASRCSAAKCARSATNAPSCWPKRRSVNDPGDEAEGRREDEVRAAEQQRDAVELAEIDAALERLAEGRYGECIDCGVAIPLPRLQARPSVARCIDCQQRYEKAAGMVA